MAVRIQRIGDSWPNHIERNVIEWWRIDDDAAGAVTAGSIELKNQAGPPAIVMGAAARPLAAIGCPYVINSPTPTSRTITLAYPALAAGQSLVVEVIYEPGPAS
jgi:hypothetical protein